MFNGLIGGVHESVWNYLWALIVPPKVKIFLWRACTECIPTGSTLMSKHVEIPEFCPLCNASIETPLHILVNCPVARGCWVQNELGNVISHHGSFKEWLAEVIPQGYSEYRNRIAMIYWGLWSNMNNLIWNKLKLTPIQIVENARFIL